MKSDQTIRYIEKLIEYNKLQKKIYEEKIGMLVEIRDTLAQNPDKAEVK